MLRGLAIVIVAAVGLDDWLAFVTRILFIIAQAFFFHIAAHAAVGVVSKDKPR